jgi:Predicted membrane protein (DUF2142)
MPPGRRLKPMRLRDRSAPLLLTLALTLLTAAWLVTNPPSAAPDESAHYVKALGAGGLDLAGEAPRAAGPPDSASQIERWKWRTSRTFTLPAGQMSTAFDCGTGGPAVSWACLDSGRPAPAAAREVRTYIGTYLPFVYVPSGALARQADDPETGLRLGRAGMAALSLLLLNVAAFLLWDPRTRGLSLVGLMVAVTPMAVFLFSTLSASGPEIAAAICFAAALLRATRDGPDSGWVWAALAVSGAVLALSRQLGPVFIALIVVAVALVVGLGEARRLFEGRRRAVAWSAVGLACAASLAWDAAYNPHPPTELGAILEVIPSSVKQLGAILRQEVGRFGWLDSPLPVPAYLAWLVMLGGLLTLGVRASPSPLPNRLGLLVLGVVGCTVALSALHRQTGFTLQGRYVIPLFVLVPLVAGELVHRNASRLSNALSRRLLVGVVATAAVVHGVAWLANGRRASVGVDGSWLYALDPEWEPPLGWLPWTVLVAIACIAYLGAGVAAWRADFRRARIPTPAGAERAAAAAAAGATLPYR